MTARLTTALAALNCGVRPATIRDWRRRGILAPCGGTPKRPLYRLEDVEAARLAPKPNRDGQRATIAA